MSRKYNFDQSQKMLQVNPKTFIVWLKKAGIDPDSLWDTFDPRQKLLTEEQIRLLAQAHDRVVHFPDEDQEKQTPPAPDTAASAALQEIASSIRQLLERVERIEARLDVLHSSLQQQAAPPDAQHTPPPLVAKIAAHPSPAPTSTPSTPSTTPPPLPRVTDSKTAAKRTSKVRKPLPKSYLPLAVFRQRHGISEKAIEVALDKKRLAVRRGRWTYEHRAITLALDRQGQQQFYDLFHAHASFQSCERCPHAV